MSQPGPRFFSDLELSRRLEKAEAHANAMFVEARAATHAASGACWIEVAGTYAMFDGPGSPVTQTFGLGLHQEAKDADLEELERFFLVRGAPVFHEVSPLAGLSTVALLNGRGYHPVELTNVMYRPLDEIEDLELRANPRIRVRPIEADEGDLWARTTARGWSEFPELAAEARLALAEALHAGGRPQALSPASEALELYERKGNLVGAERTRAFLEAAQA